MHQSAAGPRWAQTCSARTCTPAARGPTCYEYWNECLEPKFSDGVHISRPSCAPVAGDLGWKYPEGDGEAVRSKQKHAGKQSEGGLHVPPGAGGPQTFLLSNIRGLLGQGGNSKTGFLFDQAVSHQAMVVSVTETWLKPSVKDAELLVNFPGYSLYRSDRLHRKC